MTPQERQFVQRAERRVAGMQPEVRAALLRAFQILRESMSEAEFARLIDAGQVDQVIARAFSQAVLDRAFIPVRQRIRSTVQSGFQFAVRDLPKGGAVDGVLAVAFDHLSPNVITAIRTLETTAINRLQGDVKETVRAYLENALRDGRAPKAVARELRSVIGIAPSQERFVENLRRELETGQYATAAERQLLDQRFNLAKLDALPAAERAARIDIIVTRYRQSFVAFNADTNAKTHTFSAYKAGQKLAWQDAQAKGVIPDGYQMMRQWVHFDAQKDPRPEHIAMGQKPPVPADQPYDNGDTYAGESDPWNCRCVDRFFLARSA